MFSSSDVLAGVTKKLNYSNLTSNFIGEYYFRDTFCECCAYSPSFPTNIITQKIHVEVERSGEGMGVR